MRLQAPSPPGRNADGVQVATKGKTFTLLSGAKTDHLIPAPFVLPMLAALRVFLERGRWVVPVETLVNDEQYKKEGRSSAAFFGRNRQVWQKLCLKMMLKRMRLTAT